MGRIEDWKLKRRGLTLLTLGVVVGFLTIRDEVSEAFHNFGNPGFSSPAVEEKSFGEALHEEVAAAMAPGNEGAFNAARFDIDQKSPFFLYPGSIRDGARLTLARAGIQQPSPQQEADANCALELATFAGTSERLTADMRNAYNQGRFEDAANLCIQRVIDLDAIDGFGKPDQPKAMSFPVGLAY